MSGEFRQFRQDFWGPKFIVIPGIIGRSKEQKNFKSKPRKVDLSEKKDGNFFAHHSIRVEFSTNFLSSIMISLLIMN